MTTARFIPIESRPLVTIDADLSEPGWHNVPADSIVKIRIRATAEDARRIDLHEVKRNVLDAGAYKVAAIEVTVAKVDRGRIEGLTEELSEIEALDAWMASEGVNGTQAAALREKTTSYLEATR